MSAITGSVENQPARRPLGIPLAWWIAVGTSFGICFGLSSFVTVIFPQLVRPISMEFGWTRTQTTGALTLVTLFMIVGAPVAGYFIDRFGPRRVLLFATLALPFAVLAIAGIHGNMLLYYAVFVMIGIAGAGGLPGTYTAIVLKWFDRHRGLGFGFPLAGVGIAHIILPPLIRTLITAYGWHVAVAMMAVTMFVLIVPMALWLFQLLPRSAAEIDGGLPAPIDKVAVADRSNVPDWQATFLTRRYMQLAIAFILLGISTLGIEINFQAMMEDQGVRALTVAEVISIQGVFTMVLRLACGSLLDRFPSRWMSALIVIMPALGVLLIIPYHSFLVLLAAVALFSVGFGGEFNVMALFASRYFGRESYGKVYGMIYAAYTIGASIGPLLLARGYDTTHSYTFGLVVLVVFILIAAGLILTLPRIPIGPAENPA